MANLWNWTTPVFDPLGRNTTPTTNNSGHFFQWNNNQTTSATPVVTTPTVTRAPVVQAPVVSTPTTVTTTASTSIPTQTSREQSLMNARRDMLAGSKNQVYNQWNPEPGFWGNLGNNILEQVKKHPLDSMSTAANGVMNIWNAYQGYKNNRAQLDLNQRYYDLAKANYEANEARNQEAFKWQRQNRLSSSL